MPDRPDPGRASMRPLTRCLAVCLAVAAILALLVALPSAAPGAPAELFLGVRNIDCSGVTVSGSGLPASTDVSVTLLDAASRDRREGQALTTSASGAFLWRA